MNFKAIQSQIWTSLKMFKGEKKKKKVNQI